MTAEQWKNRYHKLLLTVEKMRQLQKDYFKYRQTWVLNQSKDKEREVDKMVSEGIELVNSKQQELF